MMHFCNDFIQIIDEELACEDMCDMDFEGAFVTLMFTSVM